MTQWEMTDGEIDRAYRLAKDPAMMVEILAGLNDVSMATMKRKLRRLGLVIPEPDKQSRSGSCWSAEEDRLLTELMEKGYSPHMAATRLPGRSAKGIPL